MGKRQSGRKKSTPILVLPIDTCCSLLSIFDRGTICPFSGCEKQNFKPFLKEKQSGHQGSVHSDADSR